MNAAYHVILWDSGNLHVTSATARASRSLKTNDYGLLNTFLGNLTIRGGV
jgi:hypothetical protein